MPGPTPKNPRLRQRQNRHSTAARLVDTNPLSGGIPELPRRRDENGRFLSWRPEVRQWWRDVWTSPMATEYVRADLHGLVLLADLLDRYWQSPTAALATEIRLQRQCFGLSPIDRRRLQWEVERGEAAEDKRQRRAQRQKEGPPGDPREALRVIR